MTVRRRSRGAVLPASLIFVAVVALTATALIASMGASSAEADAWANREQARFAAEAGVLAALAEIDRQRDDLLAGEAPELTGEWDLEGESDRVWSIRVLSVESEAARLPERFVPRSTSAMGESRGAVETRVETEDEPAPALETTRLANDPPVQAGVGSAAAGISERGEARIVVTDGLTDDDLQRIRERLGDEAGDAARRDRSSSSFASRSGFVRWLFGPAGPSEPGMRAAWYDLIEFGERPERTPRVDLNRAPAPVLALALGIEDASDIVRTRERLASDDRASPLWIVEEGLMSVESFAAVSDRVATRSLQWRVRVEAARPIEEQGSASDEFGVLEIATPSEYPIVYEFVVDASSTPPTIVALDAGVLVRRPSDRSAPGEPDGGSLSVNDDRTGGMGVPGGDAFDLPPDFALPGDPAGGSSAQEAP